MLHTLLSKKALTFGEVFTEKLAAGYAGTLPRLLAYYPVANANPFQRLLYRASQDAGYMILPAYTLEDLDAVRWRGRSVIHLHWLAGILKGIDGFNQGIEKIQAFMDLLDRWHKHGHKILWTMHNVLPHDVADIRLHCYFRERLIRKVDAIHIMNKDSAAIAGEYYALPQEKTIYCPHVSFAGWYPNVAGKAQSRSELLLERDAFYFLCIGSISPYKKIKELIASFAILSRSRPEARLLIAGIPGDKGYVDEVVAMAAGVSGVTVNPVKLADSQFQFYLNACDIVVLPYKTLNSGVAVMAYDFKKHCVGPKNSGVAAIYSKDYALLYDAERENGLPDMLHKAISRDLSSIAYPQLDIASSTISQRFFEHLDKNIF